MSTHFEKPQAEAQREAALAAPDCSVKCAVQLCGGTAVCELAVEGEWFPICAAHSVNRVLPRRRLSPNAQRSDRP